ncbi:MAG TPA: hypothetical protein VKK81_02030 [Candidatus Binatia bacterium]|nr:hypothetical protein [Candidatus Binatia bacterium]
MQYKGLSFYFALLALVLFMSTAALAADETQQGKGISPGAGETHQSKSVLPDAGETQQGKGVLPSTDETRQGKGVTAGASETHQGKVLAAGAGKLTMEDTMAKMQYTHEVASNADIMCEGKKCGLSDVKMGDMVQVTIDKQGDKTVFTKIEVKKANSPS